MSKEITITDGLPKGWLDRPKRSEFVEAYVCAADYLSSTVTPDDPASAFPTLFVARHALELAMKSLLTALRLPPERKVRGRRWGKSHHLAELWALVLERQGTGDDEIWNATRIVVEEPMLWIDRKDGTSFRLRFFDYEDPGHLPIDVSNVQDKVQNLNRAVRAIARLETHALLTEES